MNKDSKIFITGHQGLVGSALLRELLARGYTNILTTPRSEVDLTDPVAVRWWFSCLEPEYIFHCAARVGGIKENIENPLSFFMENIKIQSNIFENAADYGAKKLLFLGSSCIYPRDCPQPIKESYLLTGPFEKAVEAYGLAKVSGVKLCEWFRQARGCDFIACLPCNLYGPSDDFNPHTAHIVPGLIARMYDAKITDQIGFEVWGDGSARRELLFSEDLAHALILIMEKHNGPEPVNAGSSLEYSVAEIAQLVKETVGYRGALIPSPGQPTGTPRKLLDNSKLRALGWEPKVGIREALDRTFSYFLKNVVDKG